uniref:ZP domain-containing protein n=1 Tax=Macrostomum lignano TaxID=282301 RepID=A0A1I8GUC2_9PLAT
VMTFIRDEPGYQVNLRCHWNLQPTNYDNPRQMYIRVPVIDFDTNDVSEEKSYKLALEFRSDDKQVRSNAKGVQVDVHVLGRDYCHRTMLFFEGSCYLITPERLTPDEAFNISKNYLGNVFT